VTEIRTLLPPVTTVGRSEIGSSTGPPIRGASGSPGGIAARVQTVAR
jgi:hypothetical protein